MLDGQERVLAELERQTTLWNDLVAAEARHRVAHRKRIRQDDAELAQLDAMIYAAKGWLATAVGEVERNKAYTELGGLLARAKERREAWMKAHRDEVREEQIAHRRALQALARSRPVWWSHREAVLTAFETARWAAMRTGDYLWPVPCGNSGTLRTRLNSGGKRLTWQDLCRGSTNVLSIRQPTPSELGSRMKAIKGDGGIRLVVRTVVCAEGATPQERCVDLLVTLHQEPPDCAVIKEARLVRRAIAGSTTRAQWSLSLIMEVPQPSKESSERTQVVDTAPWTVSIGPDQAQAASVGLSGENAQSLHVATASARAGTITATLPAGCIEALRRASHLQMMRRAGTALLLVDLRQWMRSIKPTSQARMRLLHVLTEWRDVPAGLREIQQALQPLRGEQASQFKQRLTQILELSEHAQLASDAAARKREHVYREFAAALVRTRQSVKVVEVGGIGSASAGDPAEINGVAAGLSHQAWRTLAAPFLLKQIIENACRREGLPLELPVRRPVSSASP